MGVEFDNIGVLLCVCSFLYVYVLVLFAVPCALCSRVPFVCVSNPPYTADELSRVMGTSSSFHSAVFVLCPFKSLSAQIALRQRVARVARIAVVQVR